MLSTIQNCDQEPIHALGLIQGHGALIAFDCGGCVIAHSANASALLGPLPQLGELFGTAHFDAAARDAIARALAAPEQSHEGIECQGAAGRAFDLALHWSDGALLAEWETKALPAATAAHYATLVHQGIQHLQRSAASSLQQLLQVATDTVRQLTGFERVMAYRFLPDDSGDVIAESKPTELPSYLHLRYPASDIPAQARRLYVQNPIRHIADVDALPVAVLPSLDPRTGQPFNLSHSILRSVSPIHIEYLKNMGVTASMSVSIVVEGKLWGLIACHHSRPLPVFQVVRLSCTVLAQVLSITVERNELSQRALSERRIEVLRGQVADALASAEDATAGLLAANEAMLGLIPSDALSIVVDNRVGSFPVDLDRAAAISVADFMADTGQNLLFTDSVTRDLPELSGALGASSRAPGILAIQISGEPTISIIWWRAELIETVNWAGEPGKLSEASTAGERLTPRKSFAVWQETVRGSSKAWTATDRFAARELKAILQEVALTHIRATERERTALLAIMGHDLRDPLQAIDMVVTLMGRGLVSSGDGVKRIEYSSRRMQSLIAYILDVSRLRTGVGLAMATRSTALEPLLRATFEQAALAHPGVEMAVTIEAPDPCPVDEDRLVQAVSNLLSNARHHGDMRFPIHVHVCQRDAYSCIDIANRLPAGSNFKPGRMVTPFNASSARNPRNKTGLGLGLYIANAIVAGHGGTLKAERLDDYVRFTIALPRGAMPAAR